MTNNDYCKCRCNASNRCDSCGRCYCCIPGPQGPQGVPGDSGPQGLTGAAGKSAYEVAVDNGYTGTETEWLSSIKGTTGAAGQDGLSATISVEGSSQVPFDDNPYVVNVGTPQAAVLRFGIPAGMPGATGPQGVAGATGANGKSAYEVAVDNGYTGTETEWLSSIKGETGPQGEMGPPGPAGAESEPVFAFLTNTSPQQVQYTHGVNFTQRYMRGISFSSTDYYVTVGTAGVYEIYYMVITNEPATVVLQTSNTSYFTDSPYANTEGKFLSGMCVRGLNAGDKFRLANNKFGANMNFNKNGDNINALLYVRRIGPKP